MFDWVLSSPPITTTVAQAGMLLALPGGDLLPRTIVFNKAVRQESMKPSSSSIYQPINGTSACSGESQVAIFPVASITSSISNEPQVYPLKKLWSISQWNSFVHVGRYGTLDAVNAIRTKLKCCTYTNSRQLGQYMLCQCNS